MPAITDYPAFVVAIILFLAIPGPGNLALLSSTAQGRVAGGLASTFGIIAGDQILLWCAVAGVAALLKAYPAAFTAVQWLGAAYLAYLGLRLMLARPGQGAVLTLKPEHFAKQSFFITLLNPKAIVFYMAFFPLFIDPARGPGLGTFAAMALTIAVLTFLYGLVATLLAHYLAERVRSSPRMSGTLSKLAGFALVGFGVKLAISK
ncbi:MAG: LysE family transporter [Burkholderiales bacterium]|nr:LysE family transporter [Burkholderiales bacterium]MBK8667495.1 LysE family transporter [Burkholderiales bacterium]